MIMSKLIRVICVAALLCLAAMIIAYYLKDAAGINIFPHRHMLFFKE